MSSENPRGRTARDDKVARGLALMFVDSTRESGVALLQEAASEGSDEANYRLGWFYMQGTASKADYDKALGYLKQAGGEFRISAAILIGVVYAQGSGSIAPSLASAEKIFNDAAASLNAQLEAYTNSPPPNDPEDMQRRLRLYDDWVVLRGYADKFGIKLKTGGTKPPR